MVGVDGEPNTSEEDQSTGNWWQCIFNVNMAGYDKGWNDFISDDYAYIVELCMYEGIISEVWVDSDAKESDDDETSEPAPVSAPIAMCYTEGLRQPVYAKGLGRELASVLNKLETTLVGSALQKQTSIVEIFAEYKFRVLSRNYFLFLAVVHVLRNLGYNDQMPHDAQVRYKGGSTVPILSLNI